MQISISERPDQITSQKFEFNNFRVEVKKTTKEQLKSQAITLGIHEQPDETDE